MDLPARGHATRTCGAIVAVDDECLREDHRKANGFARYRPDARNIDLACIAANASRARAASRFYRVTLADAREVRTTRCPGSGSRQGGRYSTLGQRCDGGRCAARSRLGVRRTRRQITAHGRSEGAEAGPTGRRFDCGRPMPSILSEPTGSGAMILAASACRDHSQAHTSRWLVS